MARCFFAVAFFAIAFVAAKKFTRNEDILPVRIALIGADESARALSETLQNVDDARVVAICAAARTNIEYSMAETLARRVKAKAFRDVTSLSKAETPDAFCVVATGRARRDAQNFALQNNVDLFLVPPLAASLTLAQTLLQNATQNRARVWISHGERFAESSENARKMLKQNAPTSIFGSWKLEENPDKSTPFLASSTRLLSLLRFLNGDIKSVFARRSATSTTLNLEFSNSANGAFVLGKNCENVLHFQSQNHHLEWRENALTIRRNNETQHFEYSKTASREELRLWVQSVESGRRTLQKSNLADALQTLRVVLALQQSAKTNKLVRLI